MKNLPKRVFNSPLIIYANFANGASINLVRFNKAYANGNLYAVYNNKDLVSKSSKVFKDYSKAINHFNRIVIAYASISRILRLNTTGN